MNLFNPKLAANGIGQKMTMFIERRQYFRIDDSMGISYRLLGKEETRVFTAEVRSHQGAIDYSANFDNRIHTLLDACKVQTPIAAELLGLLNKKLNFVIGQMDIDTRVVKSDPYPIRDVSVSACGMGFTGSEVLKVGQMLQLDIVLLPTELKIVTLAEVVACELLESEKIVGDCRHFLRLSFPDMSQTDQELLIQHIIKKQSSQLLQKRRETNH